MNNLIGLLGLAMRAGKVKFGSELSIKAMRDGAAHLVILAGDASDATKKRLYERCAFYNVELITFADKARLGKALGKGEVAAAAVCDRGFATAMLKIYGGGELG